MRVIKILLIEDDEDDVLITKEYLQDIENFSFEVTWEPELNAARNKILKGNYDLFLIDYRLGRENGLELIKLIRDANVITPAIILTGQGDLKVDVDASSSGASDYLVKAELTPAIFERSIRYALSQAEIVKELDEKEKKYRSLFERSMDALFLSTDELVLMDVNASFLNFFGYTEDEISDLTLDKIFVNESDYQFFRETLVASEHIKEFEVSLITKSGTVKECLLNCTFIADQASDFCCYQGIIHDLTMRKQAEAEMLVAERLSLTGKIARTIAHEVRNPLTNLNLALDQLRSELPEDNEAIKLYGDIIERNSNRIEQLIGEMLNSSKGKELNVELVPVSEILDGAIDLAIDRIKLNQMELKKNYQPDLPRILADKEKIQIAVLNIIINAIEAMSPGKGILGITTSMINDGAAIQVEIRDNGKGIPAGEVKKLFDPFFSSKQNGMGLGLTSTKNILNSHSAQVEVTSQVGEGTSFYIQFKLAN